MLPLFGFRDLDETFLKNQKMTDTYKIVCNAMQQTKF